MSFLPLILIAFPVGVLAGLLSIGGGLLLIPAMLFLYPLFDPQHPYAMTAITGLSAMQSLASSLSASLTHVHKQNMHFGLVIYLGLSTMIGAYLGGITSGWYPDLVLKAIYAVFLLCVLIQEIVSQRFDGAPLATGPWEMTPELRARHRYSLPLVGGLAGYISGLMGIGGAVFILPMMTRWLGVPIRLAVGSCTGVILLNAMTMFVGKMQSNVIPFPDAFFLAAGASLGAVIGARLSFHTPENVLRRILIIVITLTFLRVCAELYQALF